MKSKIRNALISILCFWTIFDVSSQSVNSNIQAFIYLPSAPTTQNGIIDLIISPFAATSPCIIDGIKYTWHHHQDGKHMMLVPTEVHSSLIHDGGAKIAKASTTPKNYKEIFPGPKEVGNFLTQCK